MSKSYSRNNSLVIDIRWDEQKPLAPEPTFQIQQTEQVISILSMQD